MWIVLAAVIAFAVFYLLDAPPDRRALSKEEGSRLRLRSLGEAVDVYRAMHAGRAPASLNDLLVVPAANEPPILEELPRDTWDGEFVYRLEEGEPRIGSCGPDRVIGTSDDLWWPR